MEHQGGQHVIFRPKQLTYMQRFLLETKLTHHNEQNHMLMKIVMGKFAIQAYRVFKHFPEDNAVILFKRQQSKTEYVYFLVLQSLHQLHIQSERLIDPTRSPITKMRTLTEKIKRKQQENYSVRIVLIKQTKKLTFKSQAQYTKFLTYCNDIQNINKLSKHINSQPFNHKILHQQEGNQQQQQQHQFTYPQIECFAASSAKQNQQVLFQTKQQIQNLKELLTTYLDTFGNKEKGGLIYKMIERSSVSFSINMLLNTINYIIFQQMNNSCYSQIEPCYWTCYQQSKRSLESDRKHVVLSGAGKVCVLQIIFMKEIESQDKKEYDMMLADFKRFYRQARIKIIRITNQKWDGCAPRINLLEDQQNSFISQVNPQLIYKFHSTLARQFTTTSAQQR